MGQLKTTPLELKMLLDQKLKIDDAKKRIENGKKSYDEIMKLNEKMLASAEDNLNQCLGIINNKVTDYTKLTFSEDGIEM